MENKPIEIIYSKDRTIRGEIYQDVDPESPRGKDYNNNLGTMVCFHKRYSLGDETDLKSDWFTSFAKLEDYLIKQKNAVIVLPLYIYDHSGITMKVGGFTRAEVHYPEWDSMQVGYIYVTKDTIRKWYEQKQVTKYLLKKAENQLRAEVEIYDQYLTGDVYGYSIVKSHGKCQNCKQVWEDITDSCWGYYGLDAVRDAVNAALGLNKNENK